MMHSTRAGGLVYIQPGYEIKKVMERTRRWEVVVPVDAAGGSE
jgi:hypothetical protein